MAERADYRTFYDSFDATALSDALHGDLATAVNAYIECCDRHVGQNSPALRWEGASGESETHTFEDFQARSAQVANLLAANGVRPGDRVAGLLPRVPELVALILGVWRTGAVYLPLFTAFGPKAIEHRLGISEARVVVTDGPNRSKLEGLADPPVIMCIGEHGSDVDFTAGVEAQPMRFEPVMRKGNDAFLMMFTSGTTGLPKGVQIPLRALLAFAAYIEVRIGSAARGRVLEHCRSGLGLRAVLRRDRTITDGAPDSPL